MPAEFSVTFKCEDWGTDGEPVGPVTVVDHERLTEWEQKTGNTDGSVPFGTLPDGVSELPWRSQSDAALIAKAYNVELGES